MRNYFKYNNGSAENFRLTTAMPCMAFFVTVLVFTRPLDSFALTPSRFYDRAVKNGPLTCFNDSFQGFPGGFFFDDGIIVHQGVSPNGDGINDFLFIEGINAYPDNKLIITNSHGIPIFEIKGYDNSSRVFDGHSNLNGTMQPPGTYFYSLAYKVGEIIKYKTGFIVLKY